MYKTTRVLYMFCIIKKIKKIIIIIIMIIIVDHIFEENHIIFSTYTTLCKTYLGRKAFFKLQGNIF